MSKTSGFCYICLRADRTLRRVDNRLEQFHVALCEFNLKARDLEYCSICEHLLKKSYNFKVRCIMAIQIIKNQKTKRISNKTPLHLLYKLLPPSSLALCHRDHYYEQVDSTEDHSNLPRVTVTRLKQSDYDAVRNHNQKRAHPDEELERKSVKVPNLIHSTDYKVIIVKNDGSIQMAKTDEIKIKTASADDGINNVDDGTAFVDDDNSIVDDERAFVDDDKSIVDDERAFVDDDKSILDDERAFVDDDKSIVDDGTASVDDENSIVDDGTAFVDDDKSTVDDGTASVDDEKSIVDDGTAFVDDDKSTVDDEPTFVDEDKSIVDDETAFADDDTSIVDDGTAFVNDDTSIVDDGTAFVNDGTASVDEVKSIVDVGTASVDNDKSIVDDGTTSVDDDKDFVDDASGIDFKLIRYDTIKRADNSLEANPSLAEIAKITVDENDSKVHTTAKHADKSLNISKIKRKLPKTKANSNGGKLSNDVPKKKRAKEDCRLERERRRMEAATRDVDGVFENSCYVRNPKGDLPFIKEQLIEDLKALFETSGEVRFPDGTVIDKEFILSSLHDKVAEFTLKLLWKFVHGRSFLMPQATRIVLLIQNKLKNIEDDIIEVEYLNTKEKMLEEFQRRKTYDSYVSAEYKCNICYQGFKLEQNVRKHMKCHDESAGSYVCSICHARVKSRARFPQHRAIHEAVYRCKLCPMLTYYHSVMLEHVEKHKGKMQVCKMCGTAFTQQSGLLRHFRDNHPLPYVCTSCGVAFYKSSYLKSHKIREHNREDVKLDPNTAVNCKYCKLAFPSESVLKTHVGVSHGLTDPNCEPNSEPMKKPKPSNPEISEKRKQELTCRVCNVVGANVRWLRSHYSSEHPQIDTPPITTSKQKNKTHLCDTCGEVFTTAKKFGDHNNLHTGALPYACASCPKRFARQATLNAHKACHLPANIECHVCGKMYRTRRNIYTHMKRHKGERAHKCEYCDKTFLYNSILQQHIQTVHYEVPTVRRPRRTLTKKSAKVDPEDDTWEYKACKERRQRHKGERSHKCENCDKKFLHKSTLKKHIQAVHLKVPPVRRRRGTVTRKSAKVHPEEKY